MKISIKTSTPLHWWPGCPLDDIFCLEVSVLIGNFIQNFGGHCPVFLRGLGSETSRHCSIHQNTQHKLSRGQPGCLWSDGDVFIANFIQNQNFGCRWPHFFGGGRGLRLLGKVQYIKIPNISCPDANQFIYEVMMRFWLHIKNLGSFWVLNGVIEDRLRWHNVSSHPRMSSFNIYNHFWPFLGGAIKTTNFNAVSWVFLHLLRVDFEEDVAALESNSHRDGIVRNSHEKICLKKLIGGWVVGTIDLLSLQVLSPCNRSLDFESLNLLDMRGGL